MVPIFNYQTFNCHLDKSTRSLWVELAANQNYINLEFLFEFESILAWLSSHIEIHSVIIKSTNAGFSEGLNLEQIGNMTENNLNKLIKKTRKLSYAMLHLPQTIIVDLGQQANNLALELAIGADIRIAHDDIKAHFNHCHHGLMPASGALSMLQKMIPHSFARNWLTSAEPITINSLINSGFVYASYNQSNREGVIQNLLKNINQQSPTQRIQTKCGLLESLRSDIEVLMNFEDSLFKASTVNHDWKEIKKLDEAKPMPAKSMATVVKLSLVKNNEFNDSTLEQ
jgi:enoyl-CoA hydratase/carnithine racemase